MNVANGREPAGPRLIAIVGPYQSGKTTVLEALLYRAGATTRQGKAADKSLAGDASPEARATAWELRSMLRGSTILVTSSPS